MYALHYTGFGYPKKAQIDAEAKAQGYTHSYLASEYGYHAMYNGDTVVVYTDRNELPPRMRLDAIWYGEPIK